MNFFATIDGVFSGVVYFIFNVIYSLVVLITAPLTGGLSLYRRYRHGSLNQVSSQSLLFSLIFALILAVRLNQVRDPAGHQAGLSVLRILHDGNTQSLSAAAVPSIIMAFVYTAIIDGAVRLFVRVFALNRRPPQRRILAATIEYYLAVPVLLIIATFYCRSFVAEYLILAAVPCLIVLISLVPSGVIGHTKRIRNRLPYIVRRLLSSAIIALGLIVLGIMAGKAADYIFSDVVRNDASGTNVVIVKLNCNVDGPAVVIHGVLVNNSDNPVIYYSDEVTVFSQEGEFRGSQLYNYSGLLGSLQIDNPSRIIAVNPHQYGQFSGSVPFPERLLKISRDLKCTLHFHRLFTPDAVGQSRGPWIAVRNSPITVDLSLEKAGSRL